MKTFWLVVFSLLIGVSAGAIVGRKHLAKSLYAGQAPEIASAALMGHAKREAGNGTWELIDVGRVYYLIGQKDRGVELFEQAIRAAGKKKKGASERMRIGRVYAEAGEWEKAKSNFDQALEYEPKDEDWLAEVGAFYNVFGEREAAEELFERSFKRDSGNYRNMLKVAGSYHGVRPKH